MACEAVGADPAATPTTGDAAAATCSPLPSADDDEMKQIDELLRFYGVVWLRSVLTEDEQRGLYLQLGDAAPKTTKGSPANFHISSAGQRRESFHDLGEMLFNRVADQLGSLSSESDTPSLRRMARAYSGDVPVKVDHVTGVAYWAGHVLSNHTDCAKPLYTMSLALGEACDFTIGRKTKRPHKNEISGPPVTLVMQSGDALFFDGGSVPHSVDCIHSGTAPRFWRQRGTSSMARVSLLFREPRF